MIQRLPGYNAIVLLLYAPGGEDAAEVAVLRMKARYVCAFQQNIVPVGSHDSCEKNCEVDDVTVKYVYKAQPGEQFPAMT
jgi:hypothetical protein